MGTWAEGPREPVWRAVLHFVYFQSGRLRAACSRDFQLLGVQGEVCGTIASTFSLLSLQEAAVGTGDSTLRMLSFAGSTLWVSSSDTLAEPKDRQLFPR